MCISIIKAFCQVWDRGVIFVPSHRQCTKQQSRVQRCCWQFPPACKLTVPVSSHWQSQPSISAVCAHSHDRCDSFWFVRFICCGPSVLKTPDCPDDGQWIRPLYLSHLKPASSRFPNHMAQEFLMSITVSLGGPDVWHERKERLCLSLASPTSGQQLVFVCAGVEVRAAPGVQRQQKLKGADAIEVKSSSSLKAHISHLSSVFGFPGKDLDCRDKGMLCWEYGIPLHLCLLNQVSGSGSASSGALVEKTEGPVLSVHLVFHRHAVASARALPPVHPWQRRPSQFSAAASVSMCCVTQQNQNNCGWKRVGL